MLRLPDVLPEMSTRNTKQLTGLGARLLDAFR
jgi:hypothetical protein